jgi:hypothetical protein
MRRPLDRHVGHVAAWLAAKGERLILDRSQTEAFLGYLDPLASFFSFRTFSDTPYTRGVGIDPLERAIQGPLAACWDELEWLNRQGAAVGVTINRTDGRGRRPEHVTRVRALFIDDDRPRLRRIQPPISPHITVETSPGRYHHYWLVRDLTIGAFGALQRCLAETFSSDHRVCALNQSMALPGFWRRKGTTACHRAELRVVRPREALLDRDGAERLLTRAGGATPTCSA